MLKLLGESLEIKLGFLVGFLFKHPLMFPVAVVYVVIRFICEIIYLSIKQLWTLTK